MPRNFIVRWTPDRLIRGMESRQLRALELMAIDYAGEVKRVISKPGPMKTPPTKAQAARLEAAGETRRPSLPGEPPRKRTGKLRASIAHAPREGGRIQRIGTPLRYGRDLELGNSRMKPRPYLRPTLRRMVGRLNKTYVRVMRNGA
jgi:hypothetical protein